MYSLTPRLSFKIHSDPCLWLIIKLIDLRRVINHVFIFLFSVMPSVVMKILKISTVKNHNQLEKSTFSWVGCDAGLHRRLLSLQHCNIPSFPRAQNMLLNGSHGVVNYYYGPFSRIPRGTIHLFTLFQQRICFLRWAVASRRWLRALTHT